MNNKLLLSGFFAGIIFISGTLAFGYYLQGYNPIQQTVSEIGKIGSQTQSAYAVMLYVVGTLSMLFAIVLYKFAKQNLISTVPAWLVGSFGLLDIGFALYPTPESMHNLIGLGHLAGYFAPLILAITWAKKDELKGLSRISWLATGLILIGLFLNLSPMFKPDLYPLEYYGVVQRQLLYSYYLWLIILSINLTKRTAQE